MTPDKCRPDLRGLRLQERDLELMKMLGNLRFASIAQLAALYFTSTSRATSRLRQLWGAGLLRRVYAPLPGQMPKLLTVYALAAPGARVVAVETGGPRPRHVSDAAARTGLFLDHTLRRNDVRICLELLHRQEPGFQLLDWKQERDQVGTKVVVKERRGRELRVPLVPDGVFVVRQRARCMGFLLEIDMGNVSIKRMTTRYRGYAELRRSGALSRRMGSMPIRLLTLTRAGHVDPLRRAALDACGGHDPGFFWFASLSAADIDLPETILSPTWLTADSGSQPQPLLSHELRAT